MTVWSTQNSKGVCSTYHCQNFVLMRQNTLGDKTLRQTVLTLYDWFVKMLFAHYACSDKIYVLSVCLSVCLPVCLLRCTFDLLLVKNPSLICDCDVDLEQTYGRTKLWNHGLNKSFLFLHTILRRSVNPPHFWIWYNGFGSNVPSMNIKLQIV
jgi:hypothetical protein